MDLKTAINHPAINVFDILPDKKSTYGFAVYTYPKPNETDDEYYERETGTFKRLLILKTKKPNHK